MTTWWGPARSRLPEIRSVPAMQVTIPVLAVRTPVDVEVVIPAFNESSRLPMTLAAMVTFLAERSWSSRVVVVDNGSCDDTAAVARAVATDDVEVVAIGCAEAGKGASVLRGLRTSSSRFVGFTDADLSTPLATLGAGHRGAERRAPPRRSPPGTPPVDLRRCRSRWAAGSAAQVFRTVDAPLVPGVHDTQCGFKFFRPGPERRPRSPAVPGPPASPSTSSCSRQDPDRRRPDRRDPRGLDRRPGLDAPSRARRLREPSRPSAACTAASPGRLPGPDVR